MKKHLKLLFRTFLSNNACVEAARTREPKYNIISVIFFLFALFFAAMPTCVTGFQQQGGAWIRGTTYAFDTAMMDFGNKVQEVDSNLFTIGDKHELVVSENWEKLREEGDKEKFPTLIRFVSWSKEEDPETNVVDRHRILEIYVCQADKTKDFNKYVKNVANNINPESDGNVKTRENWLEEEENPKKEGEYIKKARSTSFIVFGKKYIQGAICPPGAGTMASSITGDYHHIKIGTNVVNDLYAPNNPNETIKKSAKFFDKVYIDTRWNNTWRSTGIILAVDSGVVILMGFMVWILTRGKNNPFRIYTLWDGQKIAYYACLTPGILSLFGFLLKNMAMMFFILFTGVRVMWLSMRTLRYQAPAKQ